MNDEKAESAAELRRGHLLETILDVREAPRSLDRDMAVDMLKEEVMHLLDQLEAAETMPAKQPPTGVWQVELTNGVVHNFVADRASGGGNVYELFNGGSGPGMTVFYRDFIRQPIVVLAVRSEKVVAYRRLADWDGDDDLDGYSSARWATASPAEAAPRPKSPTLPFGAQGVSPFAPVSTP